MTARVRLPWLVIGVLGLVAWVDLPLQPPPASARSTERRGAVSGVVRDSVTKVPIADALVFLGPPASNENPYQLSDLQGRFAFTGLGCWDRLLACFEVRLCRRR